MYERWRNPSVTQGSSERSLQGGSFRIDPNVVKSIKDFAEATKDPNAAQCSREEAVPGEASDKSKVPVSTMNYIRSKLLEQEERIDAIDQKYQAAQILLIARLELENAIGVVLKMKQFLKCEAERKLALRQMDDLKALLDMCERGEVGEDLATSPSCCTSLVQSILERGGQSSLNQSSVHDDLSNQELLQDAIERFGKKCKDESHHHHHRKRGASGRRVTRAQSSPSVVPQRGFQIPVWQSERDRPET